jgi:hypothetical protein
MEAQCSQAEAVIEQLNHDYVLLRQIRMLPPG